MGRTPCCEKQGLKKGPWTPEEDKVLVDYIQAHGHGVWRSLPKQAGLLRCGKSCRLRWINYLRPDIRRGPFTPEEQERIVQLHGIVGNKWSAIAAQMPGRTDNEVKNYWNTHLRKRLFCRAPKASAFLPPPPPPCARGGGGGGGGGTHHTARRGDAKLEDDDTCLSADLPLASPHSAAVGPFAAAMAAQPDVFLRIWHSEVGAAFRVRGGAATTTAVSPASSSAMHGSSLTIKEEDAEGRAGPDAACIDEPKQIGDCGSSGGGGGRGDAGAWSWSSIDTGKERAEKAPEAYLSFIGEDMELAGLFPEALGCFSSWLGGDLVEEAYMDCK